MTVPVGGGSGRPDDATAAVQTSATSATSIMRGFMGLLVIDGKIASPGWGRRT